jgi:hypothetical protein
MDLKETYSEADTSEELPLLEVSVELEDELTLPVPEEGSGELQQGY